MTKAPPLKEDEASSRSNCTNALCEWKEAQARVRRDTTVDDTDWVTDAFDIVDIYSLFVFAIFGGLKFLALFVPLFVAMVVPVTLNWLFALAQRHHHSSKWLSMRRIKPSLIHKILVGFCALPALLLILCSLLVDLVCMQVFGIVYALLAWRWRAVLKNFKVLAPFRGGSPLLLNLSEIMVAAAGMVMRQGLAEFMYSFTNMFLLVPWIKYWMSANPWMHILGVRFVTQIGAPLDDLPLSTVTRRFSRAISWAQLNPEETSRIDELFFTPHYPFPFSAAATSPNITATSSDEEISKSLPTHHRKYWAIGMQQATHTCTLVHTTHFPSSFFDAPLSNSCAQPVYNVMLWRNNPYHLYTGYVEANVSSQRQGVEHPMWIVSGHNDLASNRKRIFASGWIDHYFHKFMPQFQKFLTHHA